MLGKYLKQVAFSDWILWLGLLLVGGFHEYISCVLACAMSVYLLLRLWKKKSLKIRKELLTFAVLALCLGYGLTCLWAVDRGMAPIGFLKFLPVALYLLCLQQQEQPGVALKSLPYFGAVLAVLSGIGMQFAWAKPLFSVAGRLAGFFQYPNSFAVFLLVCQLLLVKKPGKKLWDYLILLLLVAGLLYTGSRTAFVVAILANVGLLFSLGKKRLRTALLVGIGAAAVLAVLLMLAEDSVLRRYLTISLTESTFVGRLLYWADALQLLLKYPMGMGYMGYYYAQQSVQTGVYSVLYVHNDLLQLLLDVGVLPGGLFIGALVSWFLKKQIPAPDKIIVGAVCLHSFFDFDLQFVGVFFLLLLLMSGDGEAKVAELKPKLGLKLAAAVAAAVSLYMAVPLGLAHFEARTASELWYPFNTQNKLAMLEQAQDYDTALPLAEEILQLNTHFFAPYSVRAGYYFTKGDFAQVIRNQREALKRNPFAINEYETYCKMLINGIDLYQKAGNTKSASICAEELLATARLLAQNEQRLSALGRLIDDQPVTRLSQPVQDYIKKIGG